MREPHDGIKNRLCLSNQILMIGRGYFFSDMSDKNASLGIIPKTILKPITEC